MVETKPAWLRVRTSAGERYASLRGALRSRRLHTVCEEARCPNRADCWNRGTATFLLLGDACTRGCAFCSVRRAARDGTVDPSEPGRVAGCAAELGLEYVVLTSVTRDDLADGGAPVFARSIGAVREALPAARVEVLIPDYAGSPLATVVASRPDVLAHNVEVVRRLTSAMRHGACGYERSLATLAEAKRLDPGLVTKSSVLLGLGESADEVLETMRDLRGIGVDVLVLGQYLRPTPSSAEVRRYVEPGEFADLGGRAAALGFSVVVAEPLARTSFHAADVFAARRDARGG